MKKKHNVLKYDKAKIISKFIKTVQEMTHCKEINSLEVTEYQKLMKIDESYYNN